MKNTLQNEENKLIHPKFTSQRKVYCYIICQKFSASLPVNILEKSVHFICIRVYVSPALFIYHYEHLSMSVNRDLPHNGHVVFHRVSHYNCIVILLLLDIYIVSRFFTL